MKSAEETIVILDPADVSLCRRRVAHLATAMSFSSVQVGELAILVSELAENVLRHGGGRGQLSFAKVTGEQRQGIEIICTDTGPGFDAEKAFVDGFSTVGSLGIGLGAVRRFADTCEVRASPLGVGAMVIARKWLPCQEASATAPSEATWMTQFDVGARSRPIPGYQVNGDAYVVRFPKADHARVALIDGLGHGVEAHEAAVRARELVEAKTQLGLVPLFRELDERLRRTRGAVAAVADIDLSTSQLAFVGVGNIEAVLVGPEGSQQFVCTSGIIGHNMRTPRLFEYRWSPESMLLLCSDGIRSAWRTGVEKKLLTAHPEILANVILSNYAREVDDATVLGIRQRRQ